MKYLRRIREWYYLVKAAPDLLRALSIAEDDIINLLNEGDFKKFMELDLGYIKDAQLKAMGIKKRGR